jgi:phospholipase C
MRCHSLLFRASAVLALGLLLSACRGGSAIGSSSGLPVANLAPVHSEAQDLLNGLPGAGKIQHIIIVVQENRSFNNLFYGYPGAKTVTYGYDSHNKKVQLQPIVLETKWDMQHNGEGFLLSCNGAGNPRGTDCRMNGFDKQYCNAVIGPCPKSKDLAYAYVPQSETKPYFSMANQYVLADEMFASDWDTSSFISHQYIITAKAPEMAFDYPNGGWGCPGVPNTMIQTISLQRKVKGAVVPCWNPVTLGDELDKKGLSWAFYASSIHGSNAIMDNGKGLHGIWSAYQAVKHIYKGADWKIDVISPPTQFLADVLKGKLRTVSWVTPTDANSDHGGSGSNTGPSWVTSLVNAVGESKYWDTSVIFIFWDDSGGWYDPEKPAYVDYDGFGFRLPLLIISPYAKKGYVSHVHYEHGSILKFAEQQFGLPSLAASDSRADSTRADCFDFKQAPRKFVKIAAPYDRDFFLHQPIDERPPDDN